MYGDIESVSCFTSKLNQKKNKYNESLVPTFQFDYFYSMDVKIYCDTL